MYTKSTEQESANRLQQVHSRKGGLSSQLTLIETAATRTAAFPRSKSTQREMEHEASELMRALSSSADSGAMIESLKGLMALIERAHGATAEELAAALRRHGAVQRLCALVDDAAPSVHRRSMAILGNLVADVFDPRASESVALASGAGVLPRLMARLGDEAFPTKLYAAACLQNMTSIDGGVCDFLNSQGAAKVLEALLRAGDDEV